MATVPQPPGTAGRSGLSTVPANAERAGMTPLPGRLIPIKA
jgi:hypothetical protein